MSNQMLTFVIGGCALGAVQLAAGMALGMWLRRCDRADGRRGRQELLRANIIAQRLHALVDEMSTSASAHRQQLDEASQLLTASDTRSDEVVAELVVGVIGNIVRANQDLQSQLETAEDRLEKQAIEIQAHISRSLTDPLTGLPNRREFNSRLEERMSAWNRRREVFSLLMLDVDYFKKLNDQHGHLAGDQMLATIARTVRSAVRREDVVARYGGEEFAVLLPNTTLEQAAIVAEKVREAVSRIIMPFNGADISATVSGGLAAVLPDESAEPLIQRADAAMYRAKQAGRNRTCLHGAHYADMPEPKSETLAELLEHSDSAANSAACQAPAQAADFGVFLEHEAISPQLAQTCEELRRYVEERGQCSALAEATKTGEP
jgi:diguanylate cyclase